MTLMDQAQRDLDDAAARYRRAYDRGYLAEQRGENGQAILDKANAEYDAAKARYARRRLIAVRAEDRM